MAEPQKQTILDLPDDMLLVILARLNHGDRLTVSLVSKSFRSLTNPFVQKLKFHDHLPSKSIFIRFWNVRIISIHSTSQITSALMAISECRWLKLERLEIYGKATYPMRSERISLSGRLGMVRSLRLEWFPSAEDWEWQVVQFVHLFSSLHKLNFFSRSKSMSKNIEAFERFVAKLGVGYSIRKNSQQVV